jgi:preprotein translocase subunit SecG
MLRIILTVVQVFSSLAIVALVLIQRGKGAEAGAGFGAGASGTVFGARGASTALSRATAIFAAIFMVNSLTLAYLGTRTAEQPKTILDVAGETAPKPPVGAVKIAPPATVPVPTPAPNSAPAQNVAPPAQSSAPAAPSGTADGKPK